jgi:hypothetical protein
MIHRIVGVPDGLKLGEYKARFLRISGDIVMYEYVELETTSGQTTEQPCQRHEEIGCAWCIPGPYISEQIDD